MNKSTLKVHQVYVIFIWIFVLIVGGAQKHAFAVLPPSLPPLFDQAIVQQLTNEIEKDQNATILKFGYFIRRNPDWLPAIEGLEILRKAANDEPVATKRWFVLQQVRAFAAPRINKSTWNEGLEACRVSLSQYEKAKNVGAEKTLERTIYEFSSAISSGAMWDISGLTDAQDTLQQALKVHLEYLKLHNKPLFAINWERALQRIRTPRDLKETILLSVPDPLNFQTQSFDLLYTMGTVLSFSEPQLALEVFNRAELLLDQSNSAIVTSFYRSKINLLEKSKRTKEVLPELQRRILQTGRGHDDLIQFWHKQKNESALTEIISSLQSTKIEESEIIAASRKLWQLGRKLQMITILKSYLDSNRAHAVENELEARVLLAQVYMNQKMWDEAEKVAIVSHITLPLPTRSAREYYQALQKAPQKITELRSTLQ